MALLTLAIILSVPNMGHSPHPTPYHVSMSLVVAMPIPRILGITVLTLAALPQILILSEILQVNSDLLIENAIGKRRTEQALNKYFNSSILSLLLLLFDSDCDGLNAFGTAPD